MKIWQSIKWRLLLWIGFLLSIILIALGVTAYEIYFSNRVRQLDEELFRRVATLSTSLYAPPRPSMGDGHDRPGPPDDNLGPPPEIGDGPPPDRTPSERPPGPPPDDLPLDKAKISKAAGLFSAEEKAGFYFLIWSSHSPAVFAQSPHPPDAVTYPPLLTKDTGTHARTRGAWREAFHFTERGNCVLVGRSLQPEYAAAHRFAGILFICGLTLLVCGVGGAWLIIKRALRPVERISRAAQKIADGKLSERISADETDSELGQLVSILNSTFTRLEATFTQQKQFTADAAHELRTPIAVLISEAQTTLTRQRNPDEYIESVTASLETAQQMRQLTDALLQLARFDAGQENLLREETDLAVIAQNCLKLIRPLMANRNLEVKSQLAPARLYGDVNRLAQVITNLLSNAIRYNRENGEIQIATFKENDAAFVSVSDTGQGIEENDLPHVFERFYRADKSRSTGGSGLGLSICKAIVEAHGGTIVIRSASGHGTTFIVSLPCSRETDV